MKENVFANIPNFILSVPTGNETLGGKREFTNKGSMFDLTKDDKIIKVTYELLVGTNFREICKTSTNDLIEMCKYPINKYNQKSFKDLLLLLQDKDYIEIDTNDFSPKDIISIDTENLIVTNGFTTITQVEMDMINNITTNNRERNSLLKCYFFIKCMVHKREDNTHKGLYSLEFGEETQTIAMDYKYINKFTSINDINKFIKLLKEHKLIDYANFLKYPIGQPDRKQDAKNVYVVCEREDNFNMELVKDELKAGINQYKHEQEKDGWVICKEYKDNDKKVNGTKGKVQQMQNKSKDAKKLEKKIEVVEEPRVSQEESKVEPIIELPKEPRIIKTKRKGTGNIVKRPEPIRPADAVNSWDYMFAEDTYKMDVPNNEVPKIDLPEVEYDDRGQVILESVLSKEELDAYYKEQFEQNGYWGEKPRSIKF